MLNAVRFFAAVLIAGAAFGALMPGMPAFEMLSRASLLRVPSLVLVALVILALVIGLVIRRRGWLAAAAAYVVGIALWIVIYLRPSPPWAPSDVWYLETWITFVGTQLAGALLFAFIAYIGSRIARLAFRLRHKDEERLRVEQTSLPRSVAHFVQ